MIRDAVGGVSNAWCLTPPTTMNRRRMMELLAGICRENEISACIIEKTEFAALERLLPPSVLCILDTHDVVSERSERMQAQGLPDPQAIRRDREQQIMRRFDRVIAIQRDDYATLTGWLGADRVLLVPHPVPWQPKPAPQTPRRLGLVASGWIANADGIHWFLDEVWPLLSDLDVELVLVGSIATQLRKPLLPDSPEPANVKVLGRIENLQDAYDAFDISINPVRVGAGLKIKSVEALSFGMPLVTTTEGARGLTAHADTAFLMEDEPQAFADAIRRVVLEPALRVALRQGAKLLIEADHDENRCYAPLLEAVKLTR
jgi:glycosyltransferase involved in cell wall biosynthesis